jgi:hypothetical protein
MTKIIKLVSIAAIMVLFSCEESGIITKCPDCTTEEPTTATLEVKLDLSFYSQTVKVEVYEGNIEDSVLFRTVYVVRSKTEFEVPLNKKYTLTAKYYIPGDYYVAIDSATPKVKYDKDQCDDPCYFVYDRIIDLRLKSTK